MPAILYKLILAPIFKMYFHFYEKEVPCPASDFLYLDSDGLHKPIDDIENQTYKKFYDAYPMANRYFDADIATQLENKPDFKGWTFEALEIKFHLAQKRGESTPRYHFKAVPATQELKVFETQSF